MTSRCLVTALALVLGATAPAWAQDWHGRDRDRHEPEHHSDGDYHHQGEHWNGADHWRDRDIHRFHEHDATLWRSGRWVHEHHDGRLGWWWVTGGIWYFYPQPTYPFPDPYLPPVVMSRPMPGPVYYFCPPLGGYYPYVAVCPAQWQIIPAR